MIEQERKYAHRFEEGYNLPDEYYEAWLKSNHLKHIRACSKPQGSYSPPMNKSPHSNSSTEQVSSAQSTALTSCPSSTLPVNNVVAVQ